MTIPDHPLESAVNRHLGVMLENTVFGFMDGLITNLSVVAGVVAAPNTSLYSVVVASIAAAFASSVSMFLGAYVSAQTRYKYTMREMAREIREVEEVPEVERQEVRDIYLKQGFTPEETEIMVQRVTSDKKLWVQMMMREELGFGEEEMSPPTIRRESLVGISTFLGSVIPLIPFLLVLFLPGLAHLDNLSGGEVSLLGALILSAIGLAIIGAFKERFGEGRPLKGALQTLAIGLGGAAITYILFNIIGYLLTR